MHGFRGDSGQTKGDKHTANYRCEHFTGGVAKVGQGIKTGGKQESSSALIQYVLDE